MNQTNEDLQQEDEKYEPLLKHPADIIFHYYNEFRLCKGLERDDLPSKNILLIDTGSGHKPVYIEESDDESVWTTDIKPEIITSIFEFGKCDTDEEIDKKLKNFKKQLLSNLERNWSCLNWAIDKSGNRRRWLDVHNNLKNSFGVYKAINNKLTYLTIAIELQLVVSKDSYSHRDEKNAEKKVSRLYDIGKKLAESSNDFEEFRRVAMEGQPRNK